MVPDEEFQRVRHLLAEALEKAYAGYKIPPVELAPGYWAMWPIRNVVVRLEETRYWNYGVPAGGTDKLQANIMWPYGNHERVKPKKPFTEKDAAKVAKIAKGLSQDLVLSSIAARSVRRVASMEDAYLMGYQAIETASEEERMELWKIRAKTYEFTEERPWTELHARMIHLLNINPADPGVLAWIPEENRSWDPLRNELGPDRLYDMAYRGVIDGLDDWAVSQGLLDNTARLNE